VVHEDSGVDRRVVAKTAQSVKIELNVGITHGVTNTLVAYVDWSYGTTNEQDTLTG